jgi:hypothetical protein
MTIKIFDGSTWNTQKSLRFYNGSTWSNAKKGWIYTGSAWSQFYPEYPLNTAAPTVSGSTTQGATLTSTDGSWTSTDAFLPASYSYQWTRSGSNISSATSSTYSTVLADVGNAIACKVTATNDRGTTTVTSSNSITVVAATPGAPSNLILSNGTPTPGAPGSATTTYTGGTTASFTFTAGSGSITKYYVLTSDSRDVPSNVFPTSPTTVTITKTMNAGPRSLYAGVGALYNTTTLSMSWTAGTNATSYDIYVGGSYVGNTASTSYNYSSGSIQFPSTSSFSVNVRSRNASGAEATGVSGTISIGGTFSSITPGQVDNITW